MTVTPWTIVLAAGAGRRLAPLTGGIPKQYWRPEGGRSLLEDTAARLRPLSPPDRMVTVVDESHRPYVNALPSRPALGRVLYQPMDRGTATGVLLPLMSVAAAAPEAIVVITPSDHGVEDEECFRRGVRRAVSRIESGRSQVVLFGVVPSVISSDFGWITPVEAVEQAEHDFQRVASFVEKPPLHHAARLHSAGAVWNTMVLVARASTLLDSYRQHLPIHFDVISAAAAQDPPDSRQRLWESYRELPPADFCGDLLTPLRSLCLYTFPTEMGWSDLGTPRRMAEWLSSQRRAILARSTAEAEQVA
jgi:mannose-1-phosphate guanylyltransferase